MTLASKQWFWPWVSAKTQLKWAPWHGRNKHGQLSGERGSGIRSKRERRLQNASLIDGEGNQMSHHTNTRCMEYGGGSFWVQLRLTSTITVGRSKWQPTMYIMVGHHLDLNSLSAPLQPVSPPMSLLQALYLLQETTSTILSPVCPPPKSFFSLWCYVINKLARCQPYVSTHFVIPSTALSTATVALHF